MVVVLYGHGIKSVFGGIDYRERVDVAVSVAMASTTVP